MHSTNPDFRSKHPSHRSRTRRLSKSGTSLYAQLDLQKGASVEEIKKSYRRLALKYHPDKNQNNPEAAEKFKEINYAHAVLTDDRKKRIYDAYGSLGLHTAETIGEDNAAAVLLAQNKWFKALAVCLILTTCGFFCCCCYCFCCCFCCGKCKPEDDDEEINIIFEEDLEAQTSEPHDSQPIVVEPSQINVDDAQPSSQQSPSKDPSSPPYTWPAETPLPATTKTSNETTRLNSNQASPELEGPVNYGATAADS